MFVFVKFSKNLLMNYGLLYLFGHVFFEFIKSTHNMGIVVHIVINMK